MRRKNSAMQQEQESAGKSSAETMISPSSNPSFAIAFGGGGARGLAHIHVIEVLDELGIRPVAIAGSSIGSIMGAAMAAGLSGKYIHEFTAGVLCNRAEVTRRMWAARPETFGELMSGGLRITQFNIERILGAFLPEPMPELIEDLKIPLKVTATDFYQQELVVFDHGPLQMALAASSAIPAVFKPVHFHGRVLIDGGIYNPVPFDLLEGMADIVIAIDVVGGPCSPSSRSMTSVDAMMGASQIMMQSISAMKLRQHRPEIYLRPPVSRFKALDFLKMSKVMEETASIREELKRAIDAAVEARK